MGTIQETFLIPFSLDKETHLIRPGCLAPEPVCATWAKGKEYGILHHTQVHDWLEGLLRDPEILFLGANIAFDFGVACAAWPDLTPLVFAAYENDRVTDVAIRQKMLDIAAGCYRGKLDQDNVWVPYRYGLEFLAKRILGIQLKKDGWRLRYGEFENIPLSGWISRAIEMQAEARVLLKAGAPFGGHEEKDLQAILLDPPEQVITYAIDDARTALAVFIKQEPCAAEYLKSQFHEARAAWALHLSSCWGMRTDLRGVEEVRVVTEAAIVDVKARLMALGIVRPDGSRDTKKATEFMLHACGWAKATVDPTLPGMGMLEGEWDSEEERAVKALARAREPKVKSPRVIRGKGNDCFYVALRDDALPLRFTKTKEIALDAEACIATEDPVLKDYERYTGLGKTLNADVPMLLKGTVFPVHCRHDIAETSRVTHSGPNLANVSKK